MIDMIEVYTGTVGSGKSYHALSRGLSRIRSIPDRYVIANFPIKAKTKKEKNRWLYFDNEEVTVSLLIKKSFELGAYAHEGHSLIILDEAGIMFNSRDWQINGQARKEWIKFFSQSRKFGYDVILVAQDMRMLDRQIRSLAEFEVKHVKANNYSLFKILPITAFFYVSFWSGGRFRGQMELGILLPWVAKKYDTMKMFSMSDEVIEIARQYGYIPPIVPEIVPEQEEEGEGVPSPDAPVL